MSLVDAPPRLWPAAAAGLADCLLFDDDARNIHFIYNANQANEAPTVADKEYDEEEEHGEFTEWYSLIKCRQRLR